MFHAAKKDMHKGSRMFGERFTVIHVRAAFRKGSWGGGGGQSETFWNLGGGNMVCFTAT